MLLQIKYWKILIISALLFDIIISFNQYKNAPLDGDIAGIVAPSESYAKVLKDPFGINVLLTHERIAAPNRYFTHISMYYYYNYIPQFISKFTNSIDSIYIANAIAKIIFHLLVIYGITLLLVDKFSLKSIDSLASMLFCSAFLHSTSYYQTIGVIDGSITYAFFYGFPCGLLAILLSNFKSNTSKISNLKFFFLTLLVIYLSFHGPIIGATFLVIFSVFILKLVIMYHFDLQKIFNNFNSYSQKQRTLAILFFILSVYSFYIGTFNIENITVGGPSLIEKYLLIPKGLWGLLTTRVALVLIIVLLIINYYLLKKTKASSQITIINYTLIFILVYLILLPLGGYRNYRPEIVRRDSILPITLTLIFLIANSGFYLYNYNKKYGISSIIVFIIFYFSDFKTEQHNKDEKELLIKIANAKTPIVALNNTPLLTWLPTYNLEDTKYQSIMLNRWGISKINKGYINTK